MCTIAKAILNSLWGKFGQNENNTIVHFVQDYQQLLTLSNNARYSMTSLDFVTEDCLQVTLTQKDEFVSPLKTGNIIIVLLQVMHDCNCLKF